MRILGLDSAGGSCSAAVLRDGRVAARRFAPMERGQTEALLPMVAAVLKEAETPAMSLDLIGVTIGPGAFTGLRIGLAAARGLGVATGAPVMGITSFAAVAAAVPSDLRADHTLVVALDSKRAELFLEASAPDGAIVKSGALVAPADLPAWLPEGPLLLAGDAASRLGAMLRGRQVALVPGSGLPDAVDVARLASITWRPGMQPPPPQPLYLRPPDTTVPRRPAASQ